MSGEIAIHAVTRPVVTTASDVQGTLLASGADRLLVPKQVHTEPGAGRSLTFAVALVAPGGGARA